MTLKRIESGEGWKSDWCNDKMGRKKGVTVCADTLSSEEHAYKGELVGGERGVKKKVYFVLLCFALL